MSSETTFKKYLLILQEFEKRPEGVLDGYDETLLNDLQISPRQLARLLEELSDVFDMIVREKKGKKTIYRLIRPIDLFNETFKNSQEIGWLFHMAHDADPEIFRELEAYTNQNPHIYQFKNTPFEDVDTLESREVFKRLRLAVEAREYRRIKFKFSSIFYDNLKCLKLIFMDNNWYIAFVDEEEKLRFGRISFIEEVQYATKISSYQPSSVEKHLAFLSTVQNSMTLFGVPPKVATLKAMPRIAKYFKEGMKPFLSSQKYLHTEPDESVVFTIEYTQPLEILPFIQKWLPDIKILEPQELRDKYVKKLSKALNTL
ncbi:MAG: WYL domain-containing protein [Epsilonproteobacteria bacterium]|nr:WYL domain-containing protein [Campylobacterota bacterium]